MCNTYIYIHLYVWTGHRRHNIFHKSQVNVNSEINISILTILIKYK